MTHSHLSAARWLVTGAVTFALVQASVPVGFAQDAGGGFVGSYTSKALKIKLDNAGSGALKGSIVMGEQTFAIPSLRLERGRLTGEFKDNTGSAFPFEATLAGGLLSFRTGDTTYLLERVVTRPVARNPLDMNNGAGPKNPLADKPVSRNPLEEGPEPSMTNRDTPVNHTGATGAADGTTVHQSTSGLPPFTGEVEQAPGRTGGQSTVQGNPLGDDAPVVGAQPGFGTQPANPGAGAGPGVAVGPGVVKLSKVMIKDPMVNNIDAVSMMIPAGWKLEGGIRWFPDWLVLASLVVRISDPNAPVAIETYPRQNYTYSPDWVQQIREGQNYMGNEFRAPPRDLATFITQVAVPIVMPHLRNARVTGQEDYGKFSAALVEAYREPNMTKTAMAGRIRFEFQQNGMTMEEDVYCALVFAKGPMLPNATMWMIDRVYSFRAPKGELDKVTPLLTTCMVSARPTLDWFGQYMYVTSLFMQRMQQGIKQAGDLSKQISQNSEEIRQMYSQAYKASSDSIDRTSRQFSNQIRGVDDYVAPGNPTPVQLPSGYNDVWTNKNGEYLLSNQAGFDPNVGATQSWERMQTGR